MGRAGNGGNTVNPGEFVLGSLGKVSGCNLKSKTLKSPRRSEQSTSACVSTFAAAEPQGDTHPLQQSWGLENQTLQRGGHSAKAREEE